MKILESTFEQSQKDIRSERELIEEILELARINSKISPRQRDLFNSAVERLIDALEKLQFSMLKYGGKESLMFINALREPMQEICMKIDAPELYKKFNEIEKNLIFKEKTIIDAFELKENDNK